MTLELQRDKDLNFKFQKNQILLSAALFYFISSIFLRLRTNLPYQVTINLTLLLKPDYNKPDSTMSPL